MSAARAALLSFEQGACRAFNRAVHRTMVRRLFATVSRLGDGWIWLALTAVLSFAAGAEGRAVGIRMLLTGFVCLALYTSLKRFIRRPRPFRTLPDLTCAVAPLDEFSFPSGHTMHAVAFTIVVTAAFPALGWVLVPLAILVGLSRVVLALHYPSDVLAGAVVGTVVARAVLALGVA